MRRTFIVMAMVMALAMSVMGAAIASTTTIYDTTPDPLPSSVVSLGYQATQTAEFGQQVTLDEAATADSVTVVMVSWACADGVIWTAGCGEVEEGNETFSHPITVNVYEDGDGEVGDLITTVTQDVNVPYRPAADEEDCGTGWLDEDGVCNNGYAFTVTFDLDGTNLPTSFIYGVAFDSAGPAAGSLNVGLTAEDASAGTAGDLYWDSTYLGREAGFTNDEDATYNSLNENWNVTARFETAPVERTADDCKNGGFADLSFRNQGQCIASFQASENAAPHN